MNKTRKQSHTYTGRNMLPPDVRGPSQCYRTEDSESTRNIRETVVSSVLCILDIFRNIIPPQTKESMLNHKSQEVDSKETVNLDFNIQPCQKDCVEQNHYMKLNDTSDDPFGIKGRQSAGFDEKLKEKRNRSSKDKRSIFGLDEQLSERNLNCSKQTEKVGMQSNLYEISESLRSKFKTPKRSHGKGRKKSPEFCSMNQVQFLKSFSDITRVKNIIGILLQPSTKREKIQCVQMLKKDRSLLTLFLKEKKKLGKKMIPIIIHKGRERVTSLNTHRNTKISNRKIAKRPDIVDKKSGFSQENGGSFTFKLKNCQSEENIQNGIEQSSYTAICRSSGSEGTFNPIQKSMENYNSECASDLGIFSVDCNRCNVKCSNEQTKMATTLEGEKTTPSPLMVYQEATRKSSMHPEPMHPEPAWDNFFTQPGSSALSHKGNEIQSLLVENTANQSLNDYLIDTTGSKNIETDNINVENFEKNCIENLTQNFENSQIPHFQPIAVKDSTQNILFSPLQQHFQYLAYGNEIVDYT